MKNAVGKSTIGWVIISALALLAGGCMSAAPPKPPVPVTLTVNGAPAVPGDLKPADVQALVIANDQLQITFGKDANGDFSGTSVKKNGQELADNLHGIEPRDVDARRTFYLDYGAGRGHLAVDTVRIIKSTPEMAHFAVIDSHNPAKLEHHFILMQNQSGIYGYVIIRTQGGGGGGGEMRTMYRFNRDILDNAWNVERTGQQPKYADLVKLENVQDETWKLPDGTIYQKYDYCAYFGESPMWGHYGHGYGVWFMPVTKESYASGPLRQDLIVHQDALILNYIGGGHLGGGGTASGTNGEKIHGPWLLYFNAGATPDAMIKDALKVAGDEQKKLPYKWVSEPLYPLNRTTVSGQLKVADGRPGAGGAWVVLAKGTGEVYRQSGDYIFYVTSDTEGKFTIPNVRAGTYVLHAWANEGPITQELIKEGVDVKGDKLDLGVVEWNTPRRNLLWQIGKADRKGSEFKYGNELRNIKWISMVPENLTYTIGVSKPADDWYYAQGKVGNWNVNFYSARTYPGNAYLTVALSGGGQCSMTVYVNDHELKTIAPNNDQSTYRAALRGARYLREEITFPASYLKIGQNTVRFNMTNAGTRWNGLMYDTIELEVE